MNNPVIDGAKIGDIRLVGTGALILTDEGWIPAEGQFLFKEEFPILGSILGNAWGGDGEVFCIPDLREWERKAKERQV